jgi:hypothetical protein
MRHHLLAKRGEADIAPLAHEQLAAERCLQLCDRLAGAGLRNADLCGRP